MKMRPKEKFAMVFLLLLLILTSSLMPPVFSSRESLKELDDLLLSKRTSEAEKNNSKKQLLSVIQPIEYEKAVDVVFDTPEAYHSYNASIINTEHGYDMICRTAKGRTNKNFFLRYDKNLNLLRQQEIQVPSHLTMGIDEDYPIVDCRLFLWNGEIWYTGWFYKSGQTVQKFAVGKLGTYVDDIPTAFQSLIRFMGPKEERWEKNWMQVLTNNRLQFIYLYDPFVLLEPNLETSECKKVFSYSPPLDFSRFRGSADPIEFENGYLMMVHERLDWKYTHRFVYLNRDFIITKISLPFIFTHVGTEFCLAMTKDHSEKKIILPVSIEDADVKLLFLDLEYVKNLLYDIPTTH